jgi:hypothetical protein
VVARVFAAGLTLAAAASLAAERIRHALPELDRLIRKPRTRPSRCRMRSCGPTRSSSSTWRRRLAQGLVFPAGQADAALSHYFRFANLATLRELAQLWLWLDDRFPARLRRSWPRTGVSEPVSEPGLTLCGEATYAASALGQLAADPQTRC